MPTKEMVTKVWIEPGCIVCDACETTAPDVFEVLDDTCIIRPAALTADFTKPRTENIKDAAAECPVDVIKYDLVPIEVSEAEAAASAPAPAAAAEAAPVAEKPKAAAHAAPAKAAAAAPAAKAAAPAKPAGVGASDPAIAALLKAATSRGGIAAIEQRGQSVPESLDALRKADPRELPPDARQAKIQEAARKIREEGVSRRAFMSSAALGIGWFAFGAGTVISIGPAFGRFMMPNVLEEPDPRVRVGKLQKYVEMQPGEVNEDYKPQGIWMIREPDRIAALNIICTHLGCIPNWLPNDRKFKCPCHGSGYKPNGINFEGPTPRPLERFRITVEDGIVVVDKSKKYQHELGQWETAGSFLVV